MGRGKRGQVAMEYLIIVGISVAMTLPLIFIFITQSTYFESDIAQAQIEKAAFQMENAAREVYYLGPPSQKTIEITFPSGVSDVRLLSSAIEFDMALTSDPYTFYQDFEMNISGAVKSFQGLHILVFEATTAGVNITER